MNEYEYLTFLASEYEQLSNTNLANTNTFCEYKYLGEYEYFGEYDYFDEYEYLGKYEYLANTTTLKCETQICPKIGIAKKYWLSSKI